MTFSRHFLAVLAGTETCSRFEAIGKIEGTGKTGLYRDFFDTQGGPREELTPARKAMLLKNLLRRRTDVFSELPGHTCDRLTAYFRQQSQSQRLVVTTGNDIEHYLGALIHRSLSGFILGIAPEQDLLQSIHGQDVVSCQALGLRRVVVHLTEPKSYFTLDRALAGKLGPTTPY